MDHGQSIIHYISIKDISMGLVISTPTVGNTKTKKNKSTTHISCNLRRCISLGLEWNKRIRRMAHVRCSGENVRDGLDMYRRGNTSVVNISVER